MPRTLMFKKYFKTMKADSTAVQMVEAMRGCDITKQVLETLPEAILVPMNDAISLCQPHPPSTWSKDLLNFVKRGDISLIQAQGKPPRPVTSHILVRKFQVLL